MHSSSVLANIPDFFVTKYKMGCESNIAATEVSDQIYTLPFIFTDLELGPGYINQLRYHKLI